MTIGWYFKPHEAGSTIRDPVASAFFASDAVSEPGAALVREGVQNSLDATLDGIRTFVRISLINETEKLNWEEVNTYFSNTALHYKADGAGLRSDDLPTENETVSALIFEDFNTKGLQGDPETPFPPKNKNENNFFHFFRAEGLTDKDPSKRGSWGLGKDAFFRASRLNSIFGLTVRKDDSRHLLMGKAVLKSHYANDDYCQDGYFGILPDVEKHLVVPIEAPDAIEKFRSTFHVERQKNDPGLSVIVPWPDPEITETAIIQAVFRNYFYTILSGDLDVMVETSGIQTLLDRETLLSEAYKLEGDEGTLTVITLAQWALNDAETTRQSVSAPDDGQAWVWKRELFSDETLKTLSERLQRKEPIAVRVPVTVRKKDGLHKPSYFDVYMKIDDSNERTRPGFIRDGIIVSDVRAPAMRGVKGLVIVNDKPLSEFLRKAENPSHTVWQGQQLKGDYVSGVTDLRFVVESVRRIWDFVMAEDKEEDKRLLVDIFPKPGTEAPSTPPSPTPSYFSIYSVSGGFRIAKGKELLPNASLVEVQVAYDVRRGNALKKYVHTDFRLDEQPVSYKCEGSEIAEINGNRMLMRVMEPENFHITVTGFDKNRQIYLRTDVVDQ